MSSPRAVSIGILEKINTHGSNTVRETAQTSAAIRRNGRNINTNPKHSFAVVAFLSPLQGLVSLWETKSLRDRTIQMDLNRAPLCRWKLEIALLFLRFGS
jgi:hypothetical protein